MKIAYLILALSLTLTTASTFAELSDRENPVEKYHLQWVIDSSQSIDVVKASISIQAPAQTVWSVIKDPNHYSDWTDAVTAKTHEVRPGEHIEFWIDLNACFGRTHSRETITVVDDTSYALAWEKSMGFGIHTQRWQLLIPSADGQSVTYYTGLKIPKPYGSTLAFFGTMKKLALFLDGFAKALKERCEY